MTMYIPTPDATSIPTMISHLAGAEVTALAMVCAVGDENSAAVLAFITPGAKCSISFRHAIEMESGYSESLLDFDDKPSPYYGANSLDIDLDEAASLIGVDRVICLVAQVGRDKVSVVSDYDDLEVTLLEAANVQYGRFIEILDGTFFPVHTHLH